MSYDMPHGFDVNRGASIGVMAVEGFARREGCSRQWISTSLQRGTIAEADLMLAGTRLWIDGDGPAAKRRRAALRQGDPTAGLLSLNDLADLLGVGVGRKHPLRCQTNIRRVFSLFTRGLVPPPCAFVGGCWFWQRDVVKKWLEDRRKKLVEELDGLVAALA